MSASTDLGSEICVLCGGSFIASTGELVAEGTACPSCARTRAATKATGLLGVAWIALALALVPFCFSYATQTVTSNVGSSTTVTTRVLIFSSSETSSLQTRVDGVEPGPVTRTYSDPIALVFGPVAALAGAFALLRSMQAKRSRSAIASAAAIGLGGMALLRALGKG